MGIFLLQRHYTVRHDCTVEVYEHERLECHKSKKKRHKHTVGGVCDRLHVPPLGSKIRRLNDRFQHQLLTYLAPILVFLEPPLQIS